MRRPPFFDLKAMPSPFLMMCQIMNIFPRINDMHYMQCRDTHGIATKKDRLVSLVMILLAVSSSTVAISSDIYSYFCSNKGAAQSWHTIIIFFCFCCFYSEKMYSFFSSEVKVDHFFCYLLTILLQTFMYHILPIPGYMTEKLLSSRHYLITYHVLV